MKPETGSELSAESELLLTTVAERYWRMPLFVGSNEMENLHDALLKCGYATKCNQTGVIVDKEKLQKALEERFGKTLVKQVFGERITTSMMNRIKDQKQLLPKKYVMIDVLTERKRTHGGECGFDRKCTAAKTEIFSEPFLLRKRKNPHEACPCNPADRLYAAALGRLRQQDRADR